MNRLFIGKIKPWFIAPKQAKAEWIQINTDKVVEPTPLLCLIGGLVSAAHSFGEKTSLRSFLR
jgi:hypothetical protein